MKFGKNGGNHGRSNDDSQRCGVIFGSNWNPRYFAGVSGCLNRPLAKPPGTKELMPPVKAYEAG